MSRTLRATAALTIAALAVAGGALTVAHASAPATVGISQQPVGLGPMYTSANWNDVMAASAKTPTLVLFSMKNCGMCNDQKPHLKKAWEGAAGKWTLGTVDTIASDDLRKKYDAKYRPTLIMFKNGQEIDRKVGFYGEAGLNAWIAYTVAHWNGGPDGAPVDPGEPAGAVGKPGTPGGGPAKPAPGQPAPSQPAPSQPAPSQPAPGQPGPGQPAPTPPAPTGKPTFPGMPGQPGPGRPTFPGLP